MIITICLLLYYYSHTVTMLLVGYNRLCELRCKQSFQFLNINLGDVYFVNPVVYGNISFRLVEYLSNFSDILKRNKFDFFKKIDYKREEYEVMSV